MVVAYGGKEEGIEEWATEYDSQWHKFVRSIGGNRKRSMHTGQAYTYTQYLHSLTVAADLMQAVGSRYLGYRQFLNTTIL